MKQLKIIQFFACSFVVLISITACKKDPVDPTIPVPQPQQPNPLPATALLKQIKWSATDHYSFSYNAQNQPLQFRSQYQFVEGDPTQIRTLVYDFQYDTQQRLSIVNQTGGLVARYFYHGDLIHNIKEYYPSGSLANETVYLYANNRIVQENFFVTNPLGESPTVYKRLLGYDGKGNLNKVETYEQDENFEFHLIQTNIYSDFDNKVNTKAWLLRYPYLPQVRWQFNNPGKEIVQYGQGQPQTTLFSHEYNAQDLPITNQENRPGGVLASEFYYW